MTYIDDFTSMNSPVKLVPVSGATSRGRGPSTRTPRTGRRPGPSASRDAIVTAARRLFSERGYDGASLRAIGAEAGVDAALVTHFFGSKANLLAAAIRWPFEPDAELERIFAGRRSAVGEELVRLFVRTWDDEGRRSPLITLLRSATTEPIAAELLHEFLRAKLLGPALARMGSDQPALRADLVAAQLAGIGLVRHVLRFEPLAGADPDDVVAWVAPTVQRYLAEPLRATGA
jgi:AcrR family transcriptional regulator